MEKILKVFLISFFLLISCSKEKVNQEISFKDKEYIQSYLQAVEAMNSGDLFFASKKFSEVELASPSIEYSSKAALLSAFCLYSLNFYPEAKESMQSFIRKYSADPRVPYAEYILVMISYEQIKDEDKDIKPLLQTDKLIREYVKKYPDTEYALDLKFKLGLVKNQLAAKELYISKYYIKKKKWIPAINRLKKIINIYDDTVFVEEALHRLVEIYYTVGLEQEAKATAGLLGYNYNSSKWYEQSYKILNKDYKILKTESTKDDEDGLIKRTIKKILN